MNIEQDTIQVSLEVLNKLPKGEFIKTGMVRSKGRYVEGILVATKGPQYKTEIGLTRDIDLRWFEVKTGKFLGNEPV